MSCDRLQRAGAAARRIRIDRGGGEDHADPRRRRSRRVPRRHPQHPREGAGLRDRRRGRGRSERLDRALETSRTSCSWTCRCPPRAASRRPSASSARCPPRASSASPSRRTRTSCSTRSARGRGVHPQGCRTGRPGDDHPSRGRRRVPHQRQGLRPAGGRLARAQGVPRAGRLRPGRGPDLRAALPARGRDPRQHRAGHDEQAGRLRAVDQRADGQEPHELDPPQTGRQRPHPSRRLRHEARAGSGCPRTDRW